MGSSLIAWCAGATLGIGLALAAEIFRKSITTCVVIDYELALGGAFEPFTPRTYPAKADPHVHGAALELLRGAHKTDLPQLEAYVTPDLSVPLDAPEVSSVFGPRSDPFGRGSAFHHGIDFAAPRGAAVLAAADGVVVKARYQSDYGRVIEIEHGSGRTTLYAHSQKLLVQKGDRVRTGQQIATVGSTGRSTGPHLHFEVRIDGLRVDPLAHLATQRTTADLRQ